MIYLLHGTSANKVYEFIDVNPKTACRMLARIRYAIAGYFDGLILKGKVEVDECWYGPKPQEDLRISKKWAKYRQRVLFGMKLREIRDKKTGELIQPSQVVIRYIGNNTGIIDSKNIIPIMQQYIHPESIIVSDGNNVYNPVKDSFSDHEVTIHNIPIKKLNGEHHTFHMKKFVYYFELPDGTKKRVHTNGIESIWKQWHRKDDDHQGASASHLQSYIDEFAFLFNIRHLTVLERFDLLLNLCCQTSIKVEELKKHFILRDVPFVTKNGKKYFKNKWMSREREREARETLKIDFSHYL
ncbi:MAG: transposase [Fluviicola sp.]|nr:transposase [Fluviicola sp.]